MGSLKGHRPFNFQNTRRNPASWTHEVKGEASLPVPENRALLVLMGFEKGWAIFMLCDRSCPSLRVGATMKYTLDKGRLRLKVALSLLPAKGKKIALNCLMFLSSGVILPGQAPRKHT